jgi:hypothetical protein
MAVPMQRTASTALARNIRLRSEDSSLIGS